MRWTTTAVCAVYVLHVLLCINAGAVEENPIAMNAGTTPSACGMCRDNGVCDHAYKGSPGHFCHTIWWSDDKPCCCPQGYACDSDRFKCRCRKEVTVKDIETTLLIVVIAVLALVMLFVIEACVDMYKRRNEVDEEDGGGGRSSRFRLFWRFVRTLKRKHQEAKCRQRRRAQDRHHRHRHYHSKHNASTTLNGDDGLVYGTAIATAGASYEFNGDTGGDLEFGGDTGSNTSFFDFAGDSGDTTSYDFGDSFAGDS